MMIPAMSSVTRTMTLETQSGTICRRMMRGAPAPAMRTAATKSLPRMVSVSARASRA